PAACKLQQRNHFGNAALPPEAEDVEAVEFLTHGCDLDPNKADSPYFAQRLLLALRVKEKSLLVDFGRDHPAVRSVRQRLAIVTEFLRQHPYDPPVSPPRPKPAPVTQPAVATVPAPTAKPDVPLTVHAAPPPPTFPEYRVLTKPLAFPDNG